MIAAVRTNLRGALALARGCLLALLAASLLAGCGAVKIKGGTAFDPRALEDKLKVGASKQAEVQMALGEPYGKGRGMLPFQEAPRTVWTYFYEEGSINMGAGKMQDRRVYLFVFFDGDRFDSYMWFTSDLK